MIKYRVDIITALKSAGYSTYRLRRERLLAENTLQQLRREELVSWKNIDRICSLLQCQPGDILEYISAEEQSGGLNEDSSDTE